MTAQTPWKLLNTVKTSEETCWTGARSFVFYPAATDTAFDYLTQQPPTPSLAHSISLPTSSPSVYPPSAGELMFGGGLTQGGHDDGAYIEQVGNVDDGTWTPAITNYLRRALAGYFADGGCCVGNEPTPQGGMEGGGDDVRVKAEWSGIVGESVDAMPWVGRVPEKISGRRAPVRSRKRGEMGGNVDGVDGDIRVVEGLGMPLLDPTPEPLSPIRLAPPGEWIAAGYSGEGMVHAWMSGKALAFMVLGLDRNPIGGISTVRHHTDEQGEERGDGLGEWFPDVFRVSEERWRQTTIDLFASRME
jgi:glycine/D-amino acid oxidase-like deaminating enzyme